MSSSQIYYVTTLLVYAGVDIMACLALNLQFGVSGLVNFGLIVFQAAGAYAAAMSSTYNSRPLTPEVLVDGSRWAVVRPRVDIDRLIAADRMPDWLGGCADDSSS